MTHANEPRRAEWMNRVCADLGRVLAEIDAEPLSAARARELAVSGAAWLLEHEPTEPRTLGEAMALAALLVVMVRETAIENEQKTRAEAS